MQRMTLKVSPERLIKLKIKQCDSSANPYSIRLVKDSLMVKPVAIERKTKKRNLPIKSILARKKHLSPQVSTERTAIFYDRLILKESNSVSVNIPAQKRTIFGHKSSRLIQLTEEIMNLSLDREPLNPKIPLEGEIHPSGYDPKSDSLDKEISPSKISPQKQLRGKKTILFKTTIKDRKISKQYTNLKDTSLPHIKGGSSRNNVVEEERIADDNSSCNNSQTSLIKKPIYNDSSNKDQNGDSPRKNQFKLRLNKVPDAKNMKKNNIFRRNLRNIDISKNRSKTEEVDILIPKDPLHTMNNSEILEFQAAKMQGLSKERPKRQKNMQILKVPSFRGFSDQHEHIWNLKQRKRRLLRKINHANQTKNAKPDQKFQLSMTKPLDSPTSLVKSFQRTPTCLKTKTNLPEISPIKPVWSNTPQNPGLKMNFSSFEAKNEGRKYLVSKYQHDVTIDKFKQKEKYFEHQRSLILKR
ncbi:unnamed protein product [Moneuplotes crassus]|uniref:Uncharacterized protein n=1 Tax=Euplotes crassus TaxID=5936 RepID=A0AAD1UFN8_EUPCR|nr:unnamed protein product [Moneuplotes crassus]